MGILKKDFLSIFYLPFWGSILLCSLISNLEAQPLRLTANHWYFGNHYGLDFSSGVPFVDNSSSIFSYEASSTMSDKEGNLLFYTNSGGRINSGVKGGIWNRDHELMEGGDLGFFLGGGYSAAQGALSIKKPGSQDQYYLFTVDELETLNVPNNPFPEGKGLSYFEIDMSANGGLGKVVTSNQKLQTPCFEYLAGTIHGNCEDYWVLARTGYQFLDEEEIVVDTFLLYLVTENGISPPLKKPIPIEYASEAIGLFRFSPDGQLFTCGGYMYAFDKNTGEIGDPVNLQTTIGIDPYYPIAFSSNGRFLYNFVIYNANTDPLEQDEIFVKAAQFDLWAPNLFLSTYVFEEIQIPSFGIAGTPQLAPDGKLYIPTHYGVSHGPTRVFVINNPNKKGAAAGFEGPVITLSHDDNQIFLRFGNFTDNIFYVDTSEIVDFNLGEDIELDCDEVGTITLTAPLNMDYYLWSTGETTATISVSEEGNYWVEVAKGCAFGSDTINVALTNDLFSIDLGNDTTICEGETFQLAPISNPQVQYFWQDGSSVSTYDVIEEGTYFVEVNIGTCFDSDTITIEFAPLPIVEIGSDTTVCLDDELLLYAGENADFIYQWQDGSAEPEFIVSEPGNYQVSVVNECGLATDNIYVDYKDCDYCPIYIPNTFSPNFDGINDHFSVFSECEFDFFNLKIFDRWGGLLFESHSKETPWNGLVKSDESNLGVYVYLLQFEFISARGERISGMRRGDVTLLR